MTATSKALAEHALTIPATVESLALLHEAIDDFWQSVNYTIMSQTPAAWRLEFETALAEVAANSIRHAYGPNQKGDVGLRLRFYPDRVCARVVDHGRPYQASSSLVAVDEDDLFSLPEQGRGLFIAGTLLDWLSYRRTSSGINCWLLLKRMHLDQ